MYIYIYSWNSRYLIKHRVCYHTGFMNVSIETNNPQALYI